MNKKIISLLILTAILLLKFSICIAQSPFQDVSFKKALAIAKEKNKLVMLYFDHELCDECNAASLKALSEKLLSQKIKKSFLAVRINPLAKEAVTLKQAYFIAPPINMLFIDRNMNLIYSGGLGKDNIYNYNTIISEALLRKKSLETLAQKEKTYFDQNKKNRKDLELLIQSKSNLEQNTELLLTEYNHIIPKDSFNTIRTLQFIARQSPVFNSKPDIALRQSSLFNDAWYSIPLQERIEINSRVFKKSIKIAARDRDEYYAKQIKYFAQQTFNNDTGKQNIGDIVMMDYYLQVKDTLKYLNVAAEFYDRYMRAIPTKTQTIDKTEEDIPVALKKLKSPVVVNAIPDKAYAYYLFNAANYFNRIDTRNEYLQKSIDWTKKALDLNPHYYIIHLYSLLLYKSGKVDEAIEYENLAITTSKKAGYEQKKWYETLANMRKGLLAE